MRGVRLPTLDEAAAVMSREYEDYADLAPDVQERVLANIDELIADGHICELNLKISGDDADNIYIGGAGELGKQFSDVRRGRLHITASGKHISDSMTAMCGRLPCRSKHTRSTSAKSTAIKPRN